MAVEIGELFKLEEALLYGLLPLRFDSSEPEETLSTYVTLYLEEEVKAEGLETARKNLIISATIYTNE